MKENRHENTKFIPFKWVSNLLLPSLVDCIDTYPYSLIVIIISYYVYLGINLKSLECGLPKSMFRRVSCVFQSMTKLSYESSVACLTVLVFPARQLHALLLELCVSPRILPPLGSLFHEHEAVVFLLMLLLVLLCG